MIDQSARALRPDHTPIPGLYAAGSNTGAWTAARLRLRGRSDESHRFRSHRRGARSRKFAEKIIPKEEDHMHDIHCSAAPERCSARIKRAAWLMRFGSAGPCCCWRRPQHRYPFWRRITRPVRFVRRGFRAGWPRRSAGESAGQKLTQALGQQVVVDNRRRRRRVAMQLAADAAPDGYTLALGSSTTFSIIPCCAPCPTTPSGITRRSRGRP